MRGGGPTSRPQIVIYCDGTQSDPHAAVVVAAYTRNDNSSWMPRYTAVRSDGTEVFIRKTRDNADAGQFVWECPHHGCPYTSQFRHPVQRVATLMDPVLDRVIAAGRELLEVTLQGIEPALRNTPRSGESPRVSL